jgi:S1/P1 Nuclease
MKTNPESPGFSAVSTLLVPLLVSLLSALLTAAPALAWNDFGHMSVAAVAYKRLSDEKKARVNELLKLNPYYGRWLEQVRNARPEDRDEQIFMLAATWPDVIKGDGNYVADGSQNGHRPEGATASQNLGYNDILLHKYWHFVDKPFSQDRTKLPPVIKPNAATQIGVFRKTLASKADDALKSYDLVWLLHLVGDVHQPLHCVTRASRNHLYGDNGGNDVLLNPQDWGNNLHGLWDYAAGSGTVGSAMQFAESLPAAPEDEAKDLKTNDWTAESFDLAKEKVYSGPVENNEGPCKVTFDYRDQAHSIALQRIALAGARLGNLLNKELR